MRVNGLLVGWDTGKLTTNRVRHIVIAAVTGNRYAAGIVPGMEKFADKVSGIY
jgi:hypothetical protein